MERPQLDAPASEWLVFGDAMQEAGDPRGELVGLSHAVDEGRTPADVRDAYVREHGAKLLGNAKSHVDAYKLTWRFSEIVGAEIHVRPGQDAATLVQALLESPSAAHVSSIALCAHPDDGATIDLGPAMALLENVPDLRRLELVDERAAAARMLVSRDFDPDGNLVTLGSLQALWPRLEHLRLVVADSHQVELGSIDAPNLTSFTFENLRYGDGWGGEASPVTARLADAKWPKLDRFALRLPETWMANIPLEDRPYQPVYTGDEDYEDRADEAEEGDVDGVNWEELAPLLQALKTTGLRELSLTSFVSGNTLVATLASVGLPPRLEVLDLSDSQLSDDDVDAMAGEHAAVFRPLKTIDIDRTLVTAEGAARLRALGPKVLWREQGGAAWRYVVGQE